MPDVAAPAPPRTPRHLAIATGWRSFAANWTLTQRLLAASRASSRPIDLPPPSVAAPEHPHAFEWVATLPRQVCARCHAETDLVRSGDGYQRVWWVDGVAQTDPPSCRPVATGRVTALAHPRAVVDAELPGEPEPEITIARVPRPRRRPSRPPPSSAAPRSTHRSSPSRETQAFLDGDDEPSREVLARLERDHETAAPTITHLDIAGPREIALIREAQAGMRADDALKQPLDPAKARELRRVSVQGRASCDVLLTAHDKLVRMYARRYYSAAGTRHGLDFDDMLQEARRGFLWGVTKFKVESGTKLSTYASFWMQQCMGRALDKTRSLVPLPYNVIELAKRAGKKGLVTEETLQAAGGGKRTLHPEIAQAAAMVWSGRDLSVNEQVGGGGEDDDESSALRVAGYLQSDEDVEERVVEADHQARRAEFAREALATLTEREQVVVRRRLMTDPPDSLDEVGRAIGVSRERVRQMEQEATAKLRVALCKLATANDLAAEVLGEAEEDDGETAAAA